MMPAAVTIVEVGPRDGLQNEPTVISPADRATLVELLSAAGLQAVEAAAFVSPRHVPQMADAEDVYARLKRRSGTRYPALVPNRAGLRRAANAQVDEIAILAAASETFSRRNINRGVDESLAEYREVCAEAQQLGIRVRAYLSTAFGCPFEGVVAPARVAAVAVALLDIGAFELAISDTIGIAHPRQVAEVVDAVGAQVPLPQIALHFHDTRGTALANVLAALHLGVSTFDASCGGLGGCPYAPGATGNLATEDLVYMLDGLGIASGVHLPGVVNASRFIEERLGHPLPSRYYQAARASERLSLHP